MPDNATDLDEASAMQMACSEHISWRFIDGGGVRYNEILNVSTEVGARIGVPLVASGSGNASVSRVVRVNYVLTGKMVAEVTDLGAFADCCRTQPDQCAGRYIGEFSHGTDWQRAVEFDNPRAAGGRRCRHRCCRCHPAPQRPGPEQLPLSQYPGRAGRQHQQLHPDHPTGQRGDLRRRTQSAHCSG